ncbi:hypothetical protein GQX74_003008 [Glossina fuscipes]|nr:hypothetical protein GQX74_003008 [Glossina fuscipes]
MPKDHIIQLYLEIINDVNLYERILEVSVCSSSTNSTKNKSRLVMIFVPHPEQLGWEDMNCEFLTFSLSKTL